MWSSAESGKTSVLARLEESLAERFGPDCLRRITDSSTPGAALVAVRSGDLEHEDEALAKTIKRAHARAVPMFVLLLEGATMPRAERLAPAVRCLAELPTVKPNEVVDVLRYVADADRASTRGLSRTVPPVLPVRPLPGRPTLVRRVRRNLARRDQILLKIAGSSAATGLVILATLGSGGASLFFFVGAVSFLLSSPPN